MTYIYTYDQTSVSPHWYFERQKLWCYISGDKEIKRNWKIKISASTMCHVKLSENEKCDVICGG